MCIVMLGLFVCMCVDKQANGYVLVHDLRNPFKHRIAVSYDSNIQIHTRMRALSVVEMNNGVICRLMKMYRPCDWTAPSTLATDDRNKHKRTNKHTFTHVLWMILFTILACWLYLILLLSSRIVSVIWQSCVEWERKRGQKIERKIKGIGICFFSAARKTPLSIEFINVVHTAHIVSLFHFYVVQLLLFSHPKLFHFTQKKKKKWREKYGNSRTNKQTI